MTIYGKRFYTIMKSQEIKANYANLQKRKKEIEGQLQTLLPNEFHNPKQSIQENAQFGEASRKKMLDGYLEAALWLGGNDGEFDGKSIYIDIAPESLVKAKGDIDKFIELANNDIYEALWGEFLSGDNAMTPEQIGHDLLLTRNGHGAGFWDRGLGEIGDQLTGVCEKMGEVYVYEGDDGMIYIDGGMNESVSPNESTDQERYEDVVFLDGSEADEALSILNQEGEDAAMEYLKQWHDHGNHMGREELPFGTSDRTYEKDGYIMGYNEPLGYISLVYDSQNDMNESGVGAVANWAGNAIGNWGRNKAKAVSNKVNQAGQAVSNKVNQAGQAVSNKVNQAGQAITNKVNQAGQAVSNTVDTAKQKYQAGQRASNIANIKKQKDAQYAANQEKLIQIKQRIDSLSQQYKQITGKPYKGGAIANPVREEVISMDETVDDYLDALSARDYASDDMGQNLDMGYDEFSDIWDTAENEPEDSDEIKKARMNHLAHIQKLKADKLSEIESLEEFDLFGMKKKKSKKRRRS